MILLDTHIWVRWLTGIHRDPADRFILATAIEHQPSLPSLDNAIAAYPKMQGILVVA